MTFNDGHAIRKLRLRHFELLAHMGSEQTLRSAAKKMALSQPAISKMIWEIEDCFGSKAFERTRTGMTPTEAGRDLIRHAVVLINELRFAGDQIAAITNGASSILRIGTFSVIPRVPTAIAKLRKRIPKIVVRVREGTGVDLLPALRDGELHCVIGALPPELLQTPETEGLNLDPIADDRLCVVAAPTHRLAGSRRLKWQDLAGEQWALPPRHSLLRRGIIDAHLQAGLPQPSPVVEMLSPISLGTLVASDPSLLGVMRLEQSKADEAAGILTILPLKPHFALPPLAFITRRKLEELPDAVRVLHGLLRRP